LPAPRRLFLPPARRWSGWAIAISVAVHSLLLLVRVTGWLPPSRLPPSIVILVPPGAEGQRAVEMKFQEPGGAAEKGHEAGITPREEPKAAPTPEAPKPAEAPAPAEHPEATAPAPAESAGPPPRMPPGLEPIGPKPGEWKLWVRPLPAPPQEIVEGITRSHVQLVDSAVSAIVQAYIDSVLNAPSAPGERPPTWTTQIFGKTFGIDSKYIYLGGLKIPSAVLALLPLKGGSATMEFSQANKLATIRADLQYAAQRAQTMDDFKRAIRELREERERQHELEQNQRLKPNKQEKKDTTKVPIP
jgi:hypothetical protein